MQLSDMVPAGPVKAVVRPGVTERLGLLLCHNTIQFWTARPQLYLEARNNPAYPSPPHRPWVLVWEACCFLNARNMPWLDFQLLFSYAAYRSRIVESVTRVAHHLQSIHNDWVHCHYLARAVSIYAQCVGGSTHTYATCACPRTYSQLFCLCARAVCTTR